MVLCLCATQDVLVRDYNCLTSSCKRKPLWYGPPIGTIGRKTATIRPVVHGIRRSRYKDNHRDLFG